MLNYISTPVFCPQAQLAQATQEACDTLSVEIYTSIQQISASCWDRTIPHHHFFLNRAYLAAFEACFPSNVECRYVVLKEQNQVLGVAYFQLLTISEANWKTGATTTTQAEGFKNQITRTLEGMVKTISGRVLVCGNMFVTGEHGFYYTSKVKPSVAFNLLYKAAEKIQNLEKEAGKKVNAIMIKDFHPDRIAQARTLKLFNLEEIQAEENMLLPIRPEWKTFDDYLQSMTAKYRTRAKSALKKGKKLERRFLSLAEIEQYQTQLHQQYKNIIDTVNFKMGVAPQHYFATLKKRLGEQFQIIGYFLDEQLVGFISLFIAPTEIEAHFIGYDPQFNRPHKIYQNVLYDIIKVGIERQVPTIWFGRTAPEIKSTVGAIPLEMNLFVKHNNYFVHQFLRPVVRRLTPPVWQQRHPFKVSS